MLPKLALVDPELTYNLPPAVTAATGLDALTQVIEPFLSVRANPLTDAISKDGMHRIARSLAKAFEDGHDKVARVDMSLASCMEGWRWPTLASELCMDSPGRLAECSPPRMGPSAPLCSQRLCK